MLELTQGTEKTILTCPSCGSSALSIEQQRVRSVLGRAIWILHARCEDCGGPANWKWTRSVFLTEVTVEDTEGE